MIGPCARLWDPVAAVTANCEHQAIAGDRPTIPFRYA